MRRNTPSNHKKAQKALAVILCLLCILCLFVAPAQGQKDDLVQIFEQVAILIRDNRFVEAEKELTAVLQVTPDVPVALNFLGTIRAKQKRVVEAEGLFLRAAAPDKTVPQLREVLVIEPENTEALVMLGDIYLAENNLQQAEESFLAALGGRLDNAGALFGLAQISRLKGETREASIYLNRVGPLLADSKSPEFLYKFGFEAMRVGMFDEAKSALERAVEQNPKEPSYLLALGIAWLRKGNLFDAEKLFRRLLEIQPNNPQGQLHLGYVWLHLNTEA